jgi:hypothetical protein
VYGGEPVPREEDCERLLPEAWSWETPLRRSVAFARDGVELFHAVEPDAHERRSNV